MRLRDPVYGCMGAISALQQQVQTLQAELNSVRGEILKYKYREAASNIIMASTHHASLVSSGTSVSVAVLPSAHGPSPPPSPPPPPPSVVVSSSASTLYTSSISTTRYNSIPSDSVSFFDL